MENLNRDAGKFRSAGATAIIHSLLGYALLTGLSSEHLTEIPAKLEMFDVKAEVPLPVIKLSQPKGPTNPKKAQPNPEGAASPANLKNTPVPIMVPPPAIQLQVPPPITAAPIAGEGYAASAGAANVPGPGTGSDGTGSGFGSGAYGTGLGGGGGAAAAVPRAAKFLRGSFRDPDYPKSAYQARREGVVVAKLIVAWNGRVSSCKIIGSSGVPALDLATCRVIKNRFEFEPARNARGRAVPDVVEWKHSWIIKDFPANAALGD